MTPIRDPVRMSPDAIRAEVAHILAQGAIRMWLSSSHLDEDRIDEPSSAKRELVMSAENPAPDAHANGEHP